MSDDFVEFLQLAGLTLWNLFPLGSMLLATWLSHQGIEVMAYELEEDEDEVWFPLPS